MTSLCRSGGFTRRNVLGPKGGERRVGNMQLVGEVQ